MHSSSSSLPSGLPNGLPNGLANGHARPPAWGGAAEQQASLARAASIAAASQREATQRDAAAQREAAGQRPGRGGLEGALHKARAQLVCSTQQAGGSRSGAARGRKVALWPRGLEVRSLMPAHSCCAVQPIGCWGHAGRRLRRSRSVHSARPRAAPWLRLARRRALGLCTPKS